MVMKYQHPSRLSLVPRLAHLSCPISRLSSHPISRPSLVPCPVMPRLSRHLEVCFFIYVCMYVPYLLVFSCLFRVCARSFAARAMGAFLFIFIYIYITDN